MPGSEFIRVTARIRPSASTTPQERIVDVTDSKNLCFNSRSPKYFTYDAVFDENVTQEQVFDELGSRIIDGCVNGFNGTIFAYGQTGSGKTHTMLGPSNIENFLSSSLHRGLIPRACEALFARLCTKAAEMGEHFKYEVTCKFVELYNEEFYDLLSNSQQKLTIRSDSKVVQLLGVSEHPVESSVDMMRILELGWESRRTAETAMNRESSRSHAIFIIDVKTEELVNTIVKKKTATLNLVDLAGSERQTQAKTIGDRFKEAININSSLSVLGRVIRILSGANRGDKHIPYRESKLTHILRDSLGGNSKTAVIVNIHPDIGYYSDTLSTLQFSAECRKIENRVHANEDLTGDTVMAYKSEINRLREELETVEGRIRNEMEAKVASLEQELQSWKEAAVSREKQLVEAQLHRDVLAAQIMSRASGEGDAKSYDDMMNAMVTQLTARIDAVKTLEDLSRVQLEDDLSNVYRELDIMKQRCESAEAARKIQSEKLKSLLEGYDDTLSGSPLRRLNLNTPGRQSSSFKTPKDRKKRRETMFTPGRNNPDRMSRAFRPVLFDDSTDESQENIEQDEDMKEERELLRLEMDNNRLKQIVAEKEATIEEICESQKAQAKQWIEEKKQYLERTSSLNSQIEQLMVDKGELVKNAEETRQKWEILSAKISASNDEKCRLEQEIDQLQAEKFEIEERLQEVLNEQEHYLMEKRTYADLRVVNSGLSNELAEVRRKCASLESKCSAEEYEKRRLQDHLGGVQGENCKLKNSLRVAEEAIQTSRADVERANEQVAKLVEEKQTEHNSLQETKATLKKMREENSDLLHNNDRLKRELEQLREKTNCMDRDFAEEIGKLKRRYANDISNVEGLVEMERNAHEMTKKQFTDFRDQTQQTFDQKIAEIRESYSNKEKRLTTDMSDKESQIMRLQAEKETLLEKVNELNTARQVLEKTQDELDRTKRELTLLKEKNEEDDRAIAALAGHQNHRQKVSYLDKIRLENFHLKQQVAELEASLKRCQGGRTAPRPAPAPRGPSTRSRSARGAV
ncbi:hypothetical protein Q1695_005437 [Nippostrongylus brasiliensis]|nr:hypothetical protein Q1695_005437 [Nippostrongylus brasiliensis]